MTQNPSTPLRRVFLHRQIAVSLAVLGAVTGILLVLLMAFATHIEQKRILEIAKSIETQTQIAKSPRHLQHAITQLVYEDRAVSVAVYKKSGTKLVAASGEPANKSGFSWLLADPQVQKQVSSSLQTGIFGLDLTTSAGRHILIAPITANSEPKGGKNIILGAKWPTPAWHGHVSIPTMSVKELFQRVKTVLTPQQSKTFQLAPDEYDGVIVVETDRGWITKLLLRGMVLITVLMVLSISAVMYVLSKTLRQHVLEPLKNFSKVISERRAGNHSKRVPVTNVAEFDQLGEQWNSLLDFRDVAQGQNMVLSSLLEHVPVGIAVTDAQSAVEYANPSFLAMTGYSLAEIIGQNPETLLKSSIKDEQALGDSLVALTNGKIWTGIIESRSKDNKKLICNTTFVPIFDRKEKVERVIAVRHDITKLKTDEQALIAAKIRAETADKAKSEFLMNMSHELRTPLNSIIGFSELIASQKLGPIKNTEYVEFARLIEASSNTLLHSINSILDLSRLETQNMTLQENTTDVSAIINRVIETKIHKARALGVSFSQTLEPDCFVECDERLLRQSIGFLLCNAIKFNKENGNIDVTCKKLNHNIQIKIADEGIGIPKNQLHLVTAPFHRVNNALNREKNGVGLGLTLVQKFADAQKIDFSITSRPGKGTVVTLTIPAIIPEAKSLSSDKLVATA
jgi:PAS domain S-box-containing protein